jgi:hypothetical protein
MVSQCHLLSFMAGVGHNFGQHISVVDLSSRIVGIISWEGLSGFWQLRGQVQAHGKKENDTYRL